MAAIFSSFDAEIENYGSGFDLIFMFLFSDKTVPFYLYNNV